MDGATTAAPDPSTRIAGRSEKDRECSRRPENTAAHSQMEVTQGQSTVAEAQPHPQPPLPVPPRAPATASSSSRTASTIDDYSHRVSGQFGPTAFRFRPSDGASAPSRRSDASILMRMSFECGKCSRPPRPRTAIQSPGLALAGTGMSRSPGCLCVV